jgi:hypothetical protein
MDNSKVPSIQISNTPTSDHDLLTRLDEKVTQKFDALTEKIDDLKENLIDRVDDLEDDLKDYKQNNDARVSMVQRLVYIGLGVILALQFVLIIYVTFFHG